jgi:hypothetical protein
MFRPVSGSFAVIISGVKVILPASLTETSLPVIIFGFELSMGVIRVFYMEYGNLKIGTLILPPILSHSNKIFGNGHFWVKNSIFKMLLQT